MCLFEGKVYVCMTPLLGTGNFSNPLFNPHSTNVIVEVVELAKKRGIEIIKEMLKYTGKHFFVNP